MTLPNTVMNLHPKSQLAVLEFLKQCYNMYNQNINIRERMREIDLTYVREKNQEAEQKRAKQSNKYGEQSRLQDLTIPVVMPQVEAATVYQVSVFLQGVPIFGVAPTPDNADEAMALEAVMAENATRGAWVRELMMNFRDGFKYNLACVEVVWDRKVTADLETDVTFGNGKQGRPKQVNWEGNCIRRMDMYNTFFDTRVAPTRVHEDGEFAGYNELMSRVKLKKFIQELPDKIVGNVTKAFESGVGSTSTGVSSASGIQNYYIPDINMGGGLTNGANQGMNWLNWAGLTGAGEGKIKYKNMYKVTTLYARIMPADFDIRVPAANTPQVWKFIVVNDSVVLYAERQTNAHGLLPMLFSQPYEDGLTYQTKSLAKNVEPIQDISSSLMNSVLAARRRAISDRGLYDPSKVTEAHINSTNPSAKIPVRPSAYGKPLSEAYYAIPFRDDQSPLVMQQLGMMGQFADKISGSNPAKQGQFVKGNKTQHEFDSVMNNSNGRDQMTSLLLEAQLFTPMKEILKINILQYQGAGSVYNPEKQQSVKVDPVALRKAVLSFKVSDGLIPTDKLINSDVLMVAMQQIGSSPQIGAGYNLAPMFSYLMKTQGADLKAFEKPPEQQAYEQAMGQYQQMCMQLAKDNKDIKPEQYPPAPKPADYGYQPQGNGPNQAPQQQR